MSSPGREFVVFGFRHFDSLGLCLLTLESDYG